MTSKLQVRERKDGAECYYDHHHHTGDGATTSANDNKRYDNDDDDDAPIAIVDCRDDADSYTSHGKEEPRDEQQPSSELNNIDIIGVPSLRADSSSLSSDDDEEEDTSSRSSSGHNLSEERPESSRWFLIRISPLFTISTILLFSSLAFVVGTICRIVVLRDSISSVHIHIADNEIMVDEIINMGVVHHPDHDHPMGQHLLLDIKHVDTSFLKSEERLVSAMVELASAAHDVNPLLSYHCHQQPMGVSCVGVLLEGHVAFHTWPKQSVISIDVFTCGSNVLISLLPAIEKLFAIPSLVNGDTIKPQMIWSHKSRGFLPNYVAQREDDIGYFAAAHNMELKHQLASKQTKFQNVDIYEHLDPRGPPLSVYQKSISNDGSYESLHPELYNPDKTLFLDGVQQSSLHGEAAYHEALVHPAMLTHDNPKRVAIIGGGEGATLREVLKHKSVEHVVMIDIDEELINLCREYLPEFSDCSKIEGSDADSCFDDSRASVLFEDAFAYFMNRFGTDTSSGSEAEKFDVIIMDALDPDKAVDIVGNLYTGNHLANSLYNALTVGGVFVVQIGESDRLGAPAVDTGPSKDKSNLISSLQTAGFQSMHTYDEGHSEFEAPWAYLVCLKDYKARSNWYQTGPDVDIQLHTRMHKTKSGQPILNFFDAATMISYQVPTKAQETSFCRSDDNLEECEEFGFDEEDSIIPMSYLEARKSTISGEYGGRGLFAAHDIPKYSMLNVEGGVKAFHVLPSCWAVFEPFYEWADTKDEDSDVVEMKVYIEDELSSFYTFTEGYGYAATLLGRKHWTVDSSIATFCNHGCNGTANYGDEDNMNVTEMNVDLVNPPEDVLTRAAVYSPVTERHLRSHLSVGDYTLRDIKAGEEIVCNYLAFVGDPDNWQEGVKELKEMCAGEQPGAIFEYEIASQRDA